MKQTQIQSSMANQTVKGIQIVFYSAFWKFLPGCYTLFEMKVSQAQHSFQKPLFCRYHYKTKIQKLFQKSSWQLAG